MKWLNREEEKKRELIRSRNEVLVPVPMLLLLLLHEAQARQAKASRTTQQGTTQQGTTQQGTTQQGTTQGRQEERVNSPFIFFFCNFPFHFPEKQTLSTNFIHAHLSRSYARSYFSVTTIVINYVPIFNLNVILFIFE